MTTSKQLDANRRNAQFSTGPTSPEGREISKLNAIKHGLTALTITLFDEIPAHYEDFFKSLMDDFAPLGAIECLLVDQLATLAWRLRRVASVEAQILNEVHSDAVRLGQSFAKALVQLIDRSGGMQHLSRYESSLRREFSTALRELQRLQEARQRQQQSEATNFRRIDDNAGLAGHVRRMMERKRQEALESAACQSTSPSAAEAATVLIAENGANTPSAPTELVSPDPLESAAATPEGNETNSSAGP
jgi:hypothetical protein